MAVEISAQDIKTMKAALRFLSKRKRISYAAMVKAFETAPTDRAITKRAKTLGFKPRALGFSVSDTTLHLFATTPSHMLKDDWVVHGIYVWIRTKHPDAWSHAAAQLSKKKGDSFVAAVREIYGRTLPDPGKIAALAGTYTLYRPHFLNPAQEAMRCRLTIGSPQNAYACALEMRFPEAGGTVTLTVQGKIVPHQGRATILMADKTGGTFILYVDSIVRGGDDHRAITLAGTLTASTNDRQSGASPFMALRTGAEITPGIVKRDPAVLPADVLARFAYGLVDWRGVQLTQAVASAPPENAPGRARRKNTPDEPGAQRTNGAHAADHADMASSPPDLMS